MSDKKDAKSGEETQKFTLSSYDPVQITLPVVTIPEAAIDQQLLTLADRYATYEKIPDREVRPDDHLFIAIESTENGQPLPGLTTEGQVLKLGEGFMPKGFEDQVASMSIGETKTFDFQGPQLEADDEGNPIMSTVTSTVTVLEIRQRVTPAITDIWVTENMPGLKTVPELREKTRSQLEAQMAQEKERYKEFQCASELAKRLQQRVPDDIFTKGLSAAQMNFERSLMQQGLTKEAFLKQQGINEQQFNMQMQMQTREMLAQSLALSALAEHLGLEVTDEEIDAVFGGRTPEQTAEARKRCEEAGQLEDARKAALATKALKWLVDTAKIEYKV